MNVIRVDAFKRVNSKICISIFISIVNCYQITQEKESKSCKDGLQYFRGNKEETRKGNPSDLK